MDAVKCQTKLDEQKRMKKKLLSISDIARAISKTNEKLFWQEDINKIIRNFIVTLQKYVKMGKQTIAFDLGLL